MAAWKVYRRNVTEVQGRKIVERLIKNGKVWGKTVTSTNDGNKFTISIRK